MKKENKIKIANRLSLFIFYSAVLFFFIGFNFQDSRMNGWLPQYLPSMPAVQQLVFLDSLNGYILSGSHFLYKTTNGGDNWFIFKDFGDTVAISKMEFLNKDSIVLCTNFPTFALFKTTNGGNNWFYYPTSPYLEIAAYDMKAFSMDTIWISGFQGIPAAVLLTTNGGLNWINKFQNNRDHFDKLYFFNRRIGFTCLSTSYDIFKTTNGGDNWFTISVEPFKHINFIDSLTGWNSGFYNMTSHFKKTTNGGINWTNQILPSGGIVFVSIMSEFANINKDTLWGCGGYAYYGHPKGIIYKTTNGGNNWGYQIPDTNIVKFTGYAYTNFINRNVGWVYGQGGVHTIIGGSDTTYYTNTKEQITNISSDFLLYQNYPNPFNQISNIKYQISNIKNRYVVIKVFDITGKEIKILVNEKKRPGTYEIKFDGSNLSSGIYFYTLFADGVRIDTKKMALIK